MPLNFFYAALIHAALPNARIVCLRRNPMDACLSNVRQLFATRFSYYDYSFDLLDTGRYYLQFDALVCTWRRALPPARFVEVQYEALVADLERESRRLVEFCDLPWNDACLNFHVNTAPVATASSVQVRSPIYTHSSIGGSVTVANSTDYARCSTRRVSLTDRSFTPRKARPRPRAVELLRVAPYAARVVAHRPFCDAQQSEVVGELERADGLRVEVEQRYTRAMFAFQRARVQQRQPLEIHDHAIVQMAVVRRSACRRVRSANRVRGCVRSACAPTQAIPCACRSPQRRDTGARRRASSRSCASTAATPDSRN
jgi:hypothetical protein